MNRLKKELSERGIIYDVDDMRTLKTGVECEASLLCMTNDFIVTVMYSNVLEPLYTIFEARTLDIVAQQSSEYDPDFFGEKSINPWSVRI